MGGPSIRTILDMGGQDCKVIRIDERGKVLNFIMNDKCAAGTGRGMEVIADVLSVPIEDIGRRSFEIDEEPAAVSNVCTVFAKSEATSLLRAGWSVDKVLAAYCAAMAQRVAGLIERMQVEREFFITGGIGKNIGVTRRIERLIGVEAVKLPADSVLDPQIAGALGASLFAHSLYRKAQKEARGGAVGGTGNGGAAEPAGEARGHGLMIANYGYEDGSGFYYITIDTDVCVDCAEHGCTKACPGQVFAIEMDDYDDLVAVVAESSRKRLRELCSVCKGQNGVGRHRAQAALHRRVPGRRHPPQLVGRRWKSGSTASASPCRKAPPFSRPAIWPAATSPVCAPIPELGCSCELGVWCGLCAVRDRGRSAIVADPVPVLACSTPARAGHGGHHVRAGAPLRRVCTAWRRSWITIPTSVSAAPIGMAAAGRSARTGCPRRRGAAPSSGAASSASWWPTSIPGCRLRRWAAVVPRDAHEEGRIRREPGLCIGCGRCVLVCNSSGMPGRPCSWRTSWARRRPGRLWPPAGTAWLRTPAPLPGHARQGHASGLRLHVLRAVRDGLSHRRRDRARRRRARAGCRAGARRSVWRSPCCRPNPGDCSPRTSWRRIPAVPGVFQIADATGQVLRIGGVADLSHGVAAALTEACCRSAAGLWFERAELYHPAGERAAGPLRPGAGASAARERPGRRSVRRRSLRRRPGLGSRARLDRPQRARTPLVIGVISDTHGHLYPEVAKRLEGVRPHHPRRRCRHLRGPSRAAPHRAGDGRARQRGHGRLGGRPALPRRGGIGRRLHRGGAHLAPAGRRRQRAGSRWSWWPVTATSPPRRSAPGCSTSTPDPRGRAVSGGRERMARLEIWPPREGAQPGEAWSMPWVVAEIVTARGRVGRTGRTARVAGRRAAVSRPTGRAPVIATGSWPRER